MTRAAPPRPPPRDDAPRADRVSQHDTLNHDEPRDDALTRRRDDAPTRRAPTRRRDDTPRDNMPRDDAPRNDAPRDDAP